MRAILIDPVLKAIGEVEFNGDYRQIYALLSDEPSGLKVDTFTIVGINDDNTIFVDDEGLLKNPRYFFTWRGYPQPLAGRGLILGTDDGGESIETTMTVQQVIHYVGWQELRVKGFVTEEFKADTQLGPDTHVHRTTPVFGPPDEDR